MVRIWGSIPIIHLAVRKLMGWHFRETYTRGYFSSCVYIHTDENAPWLAHCSGTWVSRTVCTALDTGCSGCVHGTVCIA